MLRLINKMKGCDYCQEVDNSEVVSSEYKVGQSEKLYASSFREKYEREISFKSKKVKGNRQQAMGN